MISPNGIGLSPDEKRLYMADCSNGRLYEFELPQPGVMAPATSMAPGRVVCTLPGFQWLDSLAVEAERQDLRRDSLEWRYHRLRAERRVRADSFPRSDHDEHLFRRA